MEVEDEVFDIEFENEDLELLEDEEELYFEWCVVEEDDDDDDLLEYFGGGDNCEEVEVDEVFVCGFKLR